MTTHAIGPFLHGFIETSWVPKFLYVFTKESSYIVSWHTAASLDLSENNPQVFFTNPKGLSMLKYSNRDQV